MSRARGSGERYCDVGRGITLCYETFGDAEAPPLLLIMGLANQMTSWPAGLIDRLVERGFHVVRFDNRDIGRSTRVDAPLPSLWRLALGRFDARQYTLADMALDTAELVRRLGLAPAHVVGVSMGGMVAQVVAAQHPDVVRSLTSMLASTGRLSQRPAPSLLPVLLRRPPTPGREAFIERSVEVFARIGSPGQDVDEVRAAAGVAYDRGVDGSGPAHQLAATIASGDRTAQVRTIDAPTLVIHGTRDRLVPPRGGIATARAIPGARLMLIDGMGHDLPPWAIGRIGEAIAGHGAAVDAAAPAAAADAAGRGLQAERSAGARE